MSGLPQFNFPAFDAAAKDLRARGLDIVSPAELDDPVVREKSLASPDGQAETGRWEDFLARDLTIVCQPDLEAIIVLEGWENSKGARLETDTARRLGKPILRYPDLDPIEEAPTGEIRVTDPKTGGQKGQKLERFDLIPAAAHAELARVYGRGAVKYADDNWRKGYGWRLSVGALERHLNRWKLGESIDPETQTHHLMMVAWHCYTLFTFEDSDLGTDDIPERHQA